MRSLSSSSSDGRRQDVLLSVPSWEAVAPSLSGRRRKQGEQQSAVANKLMLEGGETWQDTLEAGAPDIQAV